jgi:hypothetical protein
LNGTAATERHEVVSPQGARVKKIISLFQRKRLAKGFPKNVVPPGAVQHARGRC